MYMYNIIPKEINKNAIHSDMLKNTIEGFPGGAVVESLPADAGYMDSCPGLGRSHIPRSGWAHEPWPLGLRIWSLCSATGEVTTVRDLCTKNKTKQNKK